MKITVEELKRNTEKPTRDMDGKKVEKIDAGCIRVNLENVGPPFFNFISLSRNQSGIYNARK